MRWYWWVLLASFLRPGVEAVMVAVGEWWFHARFRRNRDRFSQLIIQITTTGREEIRVNEIIAEIRAYDLSMPFQIWVANEPGLTDRYPHADRVITVDPSFTTRAEYKARALEYTRQIRVREGLNRDDVKIVFVDDDTSPTRAYIETAFVGDYDLCQGVTAPRIKYGAGPFKHFLLSHMDDMRFLACFIFCSFFQGVVGKPLYVHGEGLCVTGKAESVATWNYPIFASEDLVFGHNAAFKGRTEDLTSASGTAKRDITWGFFHEYIQLTSPWTWGAYLKQRRRWLWGNIHAMTHRDVLPFWSAVMVGAKYLLGFVTYGFSIASIILIMMGVMHPPQYIYTWCYAALIAWLGAFAVSGWVNSELPEAEVRSRIGHVGHRVGQSIIAVLLCPVTATWTCVALVIAFFMGNPRSFEVIAKTADTSKKKKVRA
jgi:Glycosyl transferase family group 2